MATLASRLNARTQSNVQLRMLPINETTQIPCHPSSSPVHFSSFFSTFDDRWSRICQKINRLLQKQLGYYELSFFAILLRRQSPLGNRLRSFSKLNSFFVVVLELHLRLAIAFPLFSTRSRVGKLVEERIKSILWIFEQRFFEKTLHTIKIIGSTWLTLSSSQSQEKKLLELSRRKCWENLRSL